jgi:hypothetical protein
MQRNTVEQVLLGPASIVDQKYPHTGVTHPLTPNNVNAWYEHRLPDGRIAVAVWLYESDDAYRRTIIVRLWNEPDSPVLIRSNVALGRQASNVTNELLAELATM